MEIILKDQDIKELLEEIIYKIFMEKPEILKEVVLEVIEDIALSKAIKEGRKGEFVDRDEIMKVIENELKIRK